MQSTRSASMMAFRISRGLPKSCKSVARIKRSLRETWSRRSVAGLVGGRGEVRMTNSECRTVEAFSSEVALLTCQHTMLPTGVFALPIGTGFPVFEITGLSRSDPAHAGCYFINGLLREAACCVWPGGLRHDVRYGHPTTSGCTVPRNASTRSQIFCRPGVPC